MSARLKKFALWLAALIVATFITIWLTDGYGWLLQQFAPPSPLKIDFQVEKRCAGGELVDLSQHFADQSLKLEWGADRLIICDPDALQTNVADAPRDLANAFPGCLHYGSGSLRMLHSSNAVCALPSGGGYICDGEAAGSYLGSMALGIEADAVSPCTDQVLSRFGFNAGF
ncbi:hypothetical protein NKH10_28640 [Mesorhizobium sp. M1340]|uniref:hypothetical protein n=1 Tax=unclassified Mesorhizobium TaxID=325217 RepID=UPI00333C9CFA